MSVLILLLLIILFIYGPQLWAKRMLARYNENREFFPGTGVGFAQHLLERMKISQVRVEVTQRGDHYDPLDKVLRLSQKNCGKKSLTAVVVAAHEVGHVIQDYKGYAPLHIRTRLILFARRAEKLGAWLMMAVPLIALVAKIPSAGMLMFLGGLISLGMPLFIHLITLPVEWDASFRRAMPILTEYLPAEDHPPARRILTACTLTYVAASLVSLLDIWRWIKILRR